MSQITASKAEREGHWSLIWVDRDGELQMAGPFNDRAGAISSAHRKQRYGIFDVTKQNVWLMPPDQVQLRKLTESYLNVEDTENNQIEVPANKVDDTDIKLSCKQITFESGELILTISFEELKKILLESTAVDVDEVPNMLRYLESEARQTVRSDPEALANWRKRTAALSDSGRQKVAEHG